MKTILFVCVENSCRSQMAEGFAKAYGSGKVRAFSAGSRPSGIVNQDAILVMNEEGIDISRQESKGFDQLPLADTPRPTNRALQGADKERPLGHSAQGTPGFSPGGLHFDYVVSMGCKDVCPIVPARKIAEWNIGDPKGKSLKFFRKTRDIIKRNIIDFLAHVT